jgi:hypothetical protein
VTNKPTPEQLREMIDGALEEIERTELEMLDLLTDVLGPEHVRQIADYIAEAEKREAAPLKREATRGPSKEPPATR